LDKEGHLILVPEQILAFREKRLRNKTVNEYLIRWKDLPKEDATWEGEQILEHPGLQLLEDKQSREESCFLPLDPTEGTSGLGGVP
jgi:hypothetical protein